MIVEEEYKYNIYNELRPSSNISYYGISALQANVPKDIQEDIAKYLFKDCTTKEGKGIIIGFEDNEQYIDYYYIVYIPSSGKTTYELINNPDFVNSIEV